MKKILRVWVWIWRQQIRQYHCVPSLCLRAGTPLVLSPQTLDLDILSNFNFSAPLYPNFPHFCPADFNFFIWREKVNRFFTTKPKGSNNSKLLETIVQSPAGWVVPSWHVVSPLTGRGPKTGHLSQKELCLRSWKIQDAGKRAWESSKIMEHQLCQFSFTFICQNILLIYTF